MKLISSLFVFITTFAANAQTDSLKVNTLSFAINFLTHGELCVGGLPRNLEVNEQEDRSQFLLGRTRLIADYERKGLKAHAVIQNNAVWGTKGNQALNLYEGWVKMTAYNGLFAQVGRVALAYDDERIIGTNDFAMAALSHDLLRVGYERHGHKLHAILAYNQNAENVYSSTYYQNGAQSYKNMQTIWYHFDTNKLPIQASLLFMNFGQQTGTKDNTNDKPSTKYQQMFGAYIKCEHKLVTFEGEYYRQTGKMVNADYLYMPIKAWMAGVKATVKPFERYGLNLGYDYLSGDDYVPVIYGGRLGLTRHLTAKGFSPLYGSKRKFYGIMDYFYESAYINGFTPGLQNAYAGIIANPIDKLKSSATYHYFGVATKLNGLGRTLGHALEVKAGYDFTKDISLTAGYTLMFGTETMNRLKQSNQDKHAGWGWFSLVVSPAIFKTKW